MLLYLGLLSRGALRLLDLRLLARGPLWLLDLRLLGTAEEREEAAATAWRALVDDGGRQGGAAPLLLGHGAWR